MKNLNAKSLNSHRHVAPLIGLLFAGLLASPGRVSAIEDPTNCSVLHGGAGNTSVGGGSQCCSPAHVGDVIPLHASLGMVANACRAINATGSFWIATGRLTNYLINVTLDPGTLVTCPGNALCQPAPYNLLITPELVGAGVSSPNGSVLGVPKKVQVVMNGEGTVLTGDPPEMLADFHSASIDIVTPCLQVVKACAYPVGTNCFPAGAPIQFTGYVTNCGDIKLTNVMISDTRTAQLLDLNGLPLVQPLTLNTGQVVAFQGSFTPTLAETCAGTAANTVKVTGTDITTFGGPNASVTNVTTVSCAICRVNPCLSDASLVNGQFQFTVTGQVGSNYVVQVSTNLSTTDWLPLYTNAAPFTFVEQNALSYTQRFYRAVSLP